MTAFSGLTG